MYRGAQQIGEDSVRAATKSGIILGIILAMSLATIDPTTSLETRSERRKNSIEHDDERTYAYTCGITKLGPEPGAQERYLDLVQRMFLASRTLYGDPSSAGEARAQPYLITASAPTWNHNSADTAIAYVDQATSVPDGWAVLVFHVVLNQDAVATQPGQTSASVHAEILNYVASKPDVFWVAPFREVFRRIRSV
jgi:hypothetical protein